jgi:hypothetical protein
MLPPREDDHGRRLHLLLQRFSAQEAGMREALAELATELARWHATARRERMDGEHVDDAALQQCVALQAEYDSLAIELVHVRLAVAGTAEELATWANRPTPMLAEALLTPA